MRRRFRSLPPARCPGSAAWVAAGRRSGGPGKAYPRECRSRYGSPSSRNSSRALRHRGGRAAGRLRAAEPPAARTCRRRPLSLVALGLLGRNREDDIADLLLRFHVPRRLDHVLQRVATIDDRPELPGLHELLEEEDVPLRLSRWQLEHHPLGSLP